MKVPADVYPSEERPKAASLWPKDATAAAGYDLDDWIGGEIQVKYRQALAEPDPQPGRRRLHPGHGRGRHAFEGLRSMMPSRARTASAKSRGRGSESRLAYLFLAPMLAIFVGFYVWPALATLVSSFFTWGMLNPWRVDRPDLWVSAGVSNYTTTLTSADFWNAGLNTAVWLVVFPLLVVTISLALSLLMWEAKRGAGFFRSAIILPMTISLAAVGVIWGFIYNPDPDKGLLNAGLRLIGVGNADLTLGPLELHLGRWLSNPGVLHIGGLDIRLTNIMIIIPAVWAFVGFGVITFTAGLTSVPAELLEAARVDGASRWQTIRHVTLAQPAALHHRRRRHLGHLRPTNVRHRVRHHGWRSRAGHRGPRAAAVAAGVPVPRLAEGRSGRRYRDHHVGGSHRRCHAIPPQERSLVVRSRVAHARPLTPYSPS